MLCSMRIWLLIASILMMPKGLSADNESPPFARIGIQHGNVECETRQIDYKKGAVTVRLIATCHLAQADYYKQLRDAIMEGSTVLFEGVSSDKAFPFIERTKDLYRRVGLAWGFKYQADALRSDSSWIRCDIPASDFVARIGPEQLKLEEKKLEDILVQWDGAEPQSSFRNTLKNNVLISMLSSVRKGKNKKMEVWEAETSKIREGILTKELSTRIQGGGQGITVFYGADHLPDIATWLESQEFIPGEPRWHVAISISMEQYPRTMDPKTILSRNHEASQLQKAGKNHEAYMAFQSLVIDGGMDCSVAYNCGYTRFIQKQFEQALPIFSCTINMVLENESSGLDSTLSSILEVARFYRGYIHMRSGDNAKALVDLEWVVSNGKSKEYVDSAKSLVKKCQVPKKD